MSNQHDYNPHPTPPLSPYPTTLRLHNWPLPVSVTISSTLTPTTPSTVFSNDSVTSQSTMMTSVVATGELLARLTSEQRGVNMAVVGVLAVVMVVGLVGNSLVLAVYRPRGGGTPPAPSVLFLLVMGGLDVSSCLLTVPYEMLDLIEPYRNDSVMLCRAFRFLTTAVSQSRGLMLLCVALDRYFKICKPLRAYTYHHAQLAVVCVLVFGVLMAWPQTLLNDRVTIATHVPNVMATDCNIADHLPAIYPVLYHVLLYLIFVAFLFAYAILYGRIFYVLWRKGWFYTSSPPHHQPHPPRLSRPHPYPHLHLLSRLHPDPHRRPLSGGTEDRERRLFLVGQPAESSSRSMSSGLWKKARFDTAAPAYPPSRHRHHLRSRSPSGILVSEGGRGTLVASSTRDSSRESARESTSSSGLRRELGARSADSHLIAQGGALGSKLSSKEKTKLRKTRSSGHRIEVDVGQKKGAGGRTSSQRRETDTSDSGQGQETETCSVRLTDSGSFSQTVTDRASHSREETYKGSGSLCVRICPGDDSDDAGCEGKKPACMKIMCPPVGSSSASFSSSSSSYVGSCDGGVVSIDTLGCRDTECSLDDSLSEGWSSCDSLPVNTLGKASVALPTNTLGKASVRFTDKPLTLSPQHFTKSTGGLPSRYLKRGPFADDDSDDEDGGGSLYSTNTSAPTISYKEKHPRAVYRCRPTVGSNQPRYTNQDRAVKLEATKEHQPIPIRRSHSLSGCDCSLTRFFVKHSCTCDGFVENWTQAIAGGRGCSCGAALNGKSGEGVTEKRMTGNRVTESGMTGNGVSGDSTVLKGVTENSPVLNGVPDCDTVLNVGTEHDTFLNGVTECGTALNEVTGIGKVLNGMTEIGVTGCDTVLRGVTEHSTVLNRVTECGTALSGVTENSTVLNRVTECGTVLNRVTVNGIALNVVTYCDTVPNGVTENEEPGPIQEHSSSSKHALEESRSESMIPKSPPNKHTVKDRSGSILRQLGSGEPSNHDTGMGESGSCHCQQQRSPNGHSFEESDQLRCRHLESSHSKHSRVSGWNVSNHCTSDFIDTADAGLNQGLRESLELKTSDHLNDPARIHGTCGKDNERKSALLDGEIRRPTPNSHQSFADRVAAFNVMRCRRLEKDCPKSLSRGDNASACKEPLSKGVNACNCHKSLSRGDNASDYQTSLAKGGNASDCLKSLTKGGKVSACPNSLSKPVPSNGVASDCLGNAHSGKYITGRSEIAQDGSLGSKLQTNKQTTRLTETPSSKSDPCVLGISREHSTRTYHEASPSECLECQISLDRKYTSSSCDPNLERRQCCGCERTGVSDESTSTSSNCPEQTKNSIDLSCHRSQHTAIQNSHAGPTISAHDKAAAAAFPVTTTISTTVISASTSAWTTATNNHHYHHDADNSVLRGMLTLSPSSPSPPAVSAPSTTTTFVIRASPGWTTNSHCQHQPADVGTSDEVQIPYNVLAPSSATASAVPTTIVIPASTSVLTTANNGTNDDASPTDRAPSGVQTVSTSSPTPTLVVPASSVPTPTNINHNPHVHADNSSSLNGGQIRRHGGKRLRMGKTTLMLAMVTLSAVLGFVPFLTVIVIKTSGSGFENQTSSTGDLVYMFCIRSYLISNVINPFVYFYVNPRFRHKVQRVLRCVCQFLLRLKHGHQHSDTSGPQSDT